MFHTDNEPFIWANLLWESGNLPLELRQKMSRRNLLIVRVCVCVYDSRGEGRREEGEPVNKSGHGSLSCE